MNDEAYVACLNERTESGIITKSKADGFFSLRINAQAKDALTVWQMVGSENGTFKPISVPGEQTANQQ
ncbi:MAG: hypothetical protein JXA30_07900 [Deltaproteobacteria bacterium]|nr:hypothetical protein [Deltaproteobacteria bacterium]